MYIKINNIKKAKHLKASFNLNAANICINNCKPDEEVVAKRHSFSYPYYLLLLLPEFYILFYIILFYLAATEGPIF